MARIRSIKPDACNSKDFAKLSFAARYFFQQLWCFLDDDGRSEYLPKKIAGEMYPHDDDVDGKTIAGWVDECVAASVLIVYEVHGDRFICAPQFHVHQKIDRRTPSKIPAPPGEFGGTSCDNTDDSTSARRVLDEDSGEFIEVPVLEVGSRNMEVGSRKKEMERAEDASGLSDPRTSGEGGSSEKKLNPLKVDLSKFQSSFKSDWENWVGHRREIRKALTPRSVELQLAELAQCADPGAVIRRAIAGGWTGLNIRPEDKAPPSQAEGKVLSASEYLAQEAAREASLGA